MDRETVITHLQIIHTWASFALERDLQFFTPKHFEHITQWVDDALKLLKEQEPKPPIHIHEEYSEHDWETDEDGNIDEWVMAYGYHNGPGCKRCGYSFCMHCNPDGWNEKPCVIDYYQCPNCRKRILNNGKNIEYCVNCGQEVKWE